MGIIVADASPLIGLARAGRLELLQRLYGSVWIPPAVRDELQIGSQRPGASRLESALTSGWLKVHGLPGSTDTTLTQLAPIVDAGEAEAIVLAEHIDCRFLLIDDRQGRSIAKRRGVPVVGVAGILLAAKYHGLIDAVLPVIRELGQEGYRLSSRLMREIARLADETME
ncbi:MAG: DUF3368 domain-containing protein [Arenicellales bacterium]